MNHSLVYRQVERSSFSHYAGDFDQLPKMAKQNFASRQAGYRDGVVLVPVPADGFFSATVALKPGAQLYGTFESRREGEAPRKTLRAVGQKTPAKRVDLVLYRQDVLAESEIRFLDEQSDDVWEIVSINARPTDEEEPIHPMTLMHNHFGSDGGTTTKMIPLVFEEELRRSFEYWADKAMAQEYIKADSAGIDYSDAVSAITMVLDAATEEGHQLSDKQICDSIPWEHLRSVRAKYNTLKK